MTVNSDKARVTQGYLFNKSLFVNELSEKLTGERLPSLLAMIKSFFN